ncbi:hypothetical protein LCGC14_1869110 [marine sediment metagenome]|uniref:Uncharacterized protein n=1 Tax=marine sediment metagenome TaxID=412755 RepID=A0A0F9J492_9ZZZZ
MEKTKSPIERLKERILEKKGSQKETELTIMLDMVREFGCLGEIIGREFEVRDPNGKLIYTISQKPIAIKQMNTLIKEFGVLKRKDDEKEAAKWNTKGKGKIGKK